MTSNDAVQGLYPIEETERMKDAAKAMLAALRDVRQDLIDDGHRDSERFAIVDNAIAQAEKAGIT